ncbi:MAG: methyltransferase domain-containing protein [Thiobacillus sp.]|nr:methyltransferase domain-containing protein [Thiobacillus sp.]
MSIAPFQALACPLDGLPMQSDGARWRCESGHSFDIASLGYTHLLPVQHKRSRDPGDSKEMIAARRRFLQAGWYRPIAAAVSRSALAGLGSGSMYSCLDAGCGEGYYLRELAAAVPADQTVQLLGLDISKWAVQSAAKQDKDPTWVVGSNARLPVLSGTVDCVLCMFGFPVYAEFARVLKPGGQLLQVDAGPHHLRELREIIYPSLKPERSDEAAVPAGFRRLPADTLQFSIKLTDAAQIADLLIMTPHLYRASAEGRAKASKLSALSLSVDVQLAHLERNRDQL